MTELRLTKRDLRISARFAIPANCVPLEEEIFKKCASGKKLTSEEWALVEKKVRDLPSFGAYLKIGVTTGAYWLGGMQLCKNFDKNKLWKPLLEGNKKRKYAPNKFLPLHLWQVILSSLAKNNGKHKAGEINLCMVRWGKVLKIEGNKVTLRVWGVNEGLQLVEREQPFLIDPRAISNVKVGDIVATHYTNAVTKINRFQAEMLKYWTKKVLKIYRKHLKLK